MGGRGGYGGRDMNLTNDNLISRYQLKSKKWNDKDLENLRYSLSFMKKHFGDMNDVLSTIKRREISGELGHYSFDEKTLYLSSRRTDKEVMLHELTHSISEQIAHNYKEFGFTSRQDALTQMANEIRERAGLQPYKWDSRKWKSRPEEHISMNMEAFADPHSKNSKYSIETLRVLKKYYKRLRKK